MKNKKHVGACYVNVANKERGITLIALIITIIVMIILVAVSVSVALQGGLFDKATEASKQTEEKAIYEEIVSAMEIDNNGDIDAKTTGNKAKEMLTAEEKPAMFEETTGILTVTGKNGTTYFYTITNKEIIIGKKETPKGKTLQTVNQETLQWRVLGADAEKEEVILISATPTNASIMLYGHKGYLNAIKENKDEESADILNETCRQLYSNNSYRYM